MKVDLTDRDSVRELADFYRGSLTDDVLPFWLRHGMDREHGGVISSLDREGNVIETDKAVWIQGRCAWTMSTAYLEVERRPEWLEAARSCIGFLEAHCFDADGRMFFRVTRDGRPVVKRLRYIFSESFAVIAMAAYSRATGDARWAARAKEVFDGLNRVRETPGILVPKFDPETRPSRGFSVPMILLATAQELRLARPKDAAVLDAFIDAQVESIERYFLCPEHRCVLEQCGPDGEFQGEHFEGRLLNPGHAIEGAWFILREAQRRGGDARLLRLGTTMLDWMWEWGWDREHGGILYYRDALGLPASEYWHDMKFWWPQNEALVAALYAFRLTGDEGYALRFRDLHDWTHARFPDREHGEWYGYLHRDGRVSTTLKGNMYKGPFHVPRMQIVCARLLSELLS